MQLQKQHKTVAGFEANGGYLLASDIDQDGKLLSALPTRDALLPILVVLAQLTEQPISKIIAGLPKRFTASGKVEHVPSNVGLAFLNMLQSDTERALAELDISHRVIQLDNTDGVRCVLNNNDIVHFRCSGNAPEMRCYVESNSPKRAETCMIRLKAKLSYLTEQTATI